MNIIRYICITLLLSLSMTTKATPPDEFESKYKSGKELYSMGKYGPAMEVLLPITREAQGNKYVQYAHYFYSLSAFKAGRMQEAYQMLLQLTQKYPSWKEIDEAYYLFANVAFEQKKYRYGLNFLKDRNERIKEDIDQLKTYYLRQVNLDTLRALQKSYNSDPAIARLLASRLSGSADEKNKMLLEYLIQEFKLDREKLFPPKKQTVKKDSYNVAILLPFMLSEIDPESVQRPSQYILEMYEGIRLAADSLSRLGVKINLFAYDTEKDISKITGILQLPDLLNADLIIGPVIPSQIPLVNEFANTNQIMVINPLSTNLKLFENNEFVFLAQPTLETQAEKVAAYAEVNFNEKEKNDVIIFYGDDVRDSIMAMNYRDIVTARKFVVRNFEKVNKEKAKRIKEVLSDSLKLTRTGHIFVAASDQVIAANIISAMEISQQPVPLVVRAEWLDFALLTFDQLERRKVHFINPEYVDYANPSYEVLKKKIIHDMKQLPVRNGYFAFLGYELMYFFGKMLKTNGTYFGDVLMQGGYTKGLVLQGFDYTSSHNNQLVPLVKFEGKELRLVTSSENEEKK